MARKLGSTQVEVLKLLRNYGAYPHGWYWENHSTTQRVLDSLVRRGDAYQDDNHVYRPTQGKA